MRSTQCLKKPSHTTPEKTTGLHYSGSTPAHNLFVLYVSMTQLSAGKVTVDSLLGHIQCHSDCRL